MPNSKKYVRLVKRDPYKWVWACKECTAIVYTNKEAYWHVKAFHNHLNPEPYTDKKIRKYFRRVRRDTAE